MNLFVSEVLSSILQIVLFMLIPFVWWFINARKKESFFAWIGFKRLPPNKSKKLLIIIIGLIALSWITGEWSLRLMDNVETATSAFDGGGVGAVPAILVYGIFHTALPEELLFRGFLLKRIKSKFGFTVGNTVQAVLFGLLHGAEFMGETEIIMVFALVIFTFTFAFADGYVNEKLADGSIMPGWCAHAVTNILSGLGAAF